MKKLSLILLLSCMFSGSVFAASPQDSQLSGTDDGSEKKDSFLTLKQAGRLVKGTVVEAGPYVAGSFLSGRMYNAADMRLKPGFMQVAKIGAGALIVRDASGRYLNRETFMTRLFGQWGKAHKAEVNGTVLTALLAAAYKYAPVSEEVRDGVILATGACVLGRMALAGAAKAFPKD